MGESFIVRRGGGGLSFLAAVIHVAAPAGSTVSFSKGGIVVKTFAPAKTHVNSDGEMADSYITVHPASYGEWTITATRGDDSASKTITVDAAKQYDVVLRYNQYLFYNGEQYTEVTGGWVPYTSASIYNGEPFVASPNTLIGNTLHVAAPVNLNWVLDFRGIDNAIDVTKFSKLEADITDSHGTSDTAHIIVCPSKTGELQPAAQITLPNTNTPATYSVDISALRGNYYVCAFARVHGNGGGSGFLTATRVELVI